MSAFGGKADISLTQWNVRLTQSGHRSNGNCLASTAQWGFAFCRKFLDRRHCIARFQTG
jgi:hypothetical protein